MINFHKYSFLDVRHLKRLINDNNYWLCQLDPIYLFIWSDLYKPEICFSEDYCYIRLFIPEVGVSYCPPIGNGNFKMALFNIEEDAWNNGIDFKLVGIDESSINKFKFKVISNENYNNYIYTIDSLALFNTNNLKKYKQNYQKYMKNNPNTYFKLAKKEDFTRILEFISIWQNDDINRVKNPYFYPSLNMLKKVMEHLYELELNCLIIQNDLGEIFAISIFHINNNMSYIHNLLCLNKEGLLEVAISLTSKAINNKAKYINFECDLGNIDKRNLYISLNPIKIEKYYTNTGGVLGEKEEK